MDVGKKLSHGSQEDSYSTSRHRDHRENIASM